MIDYFCADLPNPPFRRVLLSIDDNHDIFQFSNLMILFTRFAKARFRIISMELPSRTLVLYRVAELTLVIFLENFACTIQWLLQLLLRQLFYRQILRQRLFYFPVFYILQKNASILQKSVLAFLQCCYNDLRLDLLRQRQLFYRLRRHCQSFALHPSLSLRSNTTDERAKK